MKKLAVLPVAALLLTFAPTAHQALAAQSAWSKQPSWTSPDDDAPRRSSAVTRSPKSLSPFAPGSNNLSVDVGQVFLMGDLSAKYSDSLGSQVHYTYGVSDIFGFDSSLGYSSHSDGKFGMTTLLTGLRTNLAWYDKVIPYAVFGLGFYRPSYHVDPNYTISPLLFGIHMGPGVSLEVTKTLFFGASLTFHDIFGSDAASPNGIVQQVGGTYTSFFVNGGVVF